MMISQKVLDWIKEKQKSAFVILAYLIVTSCYGTFEAGWKIYDYFLQKKKENCLILIEGQNKYTRIVDNFLSSPQNEPLGFPFHEKLRLNFGVTMDPRYRGLIIGSNDHTECKNGLHYRVPEASQDASFFDSSLPSDDLQCLINEAHQLASWMNSEPIPIPHSKAVDVIDNPRNFRWDDGHDKFKEFKCKSSITEANCIKFQEYLNNLIVASKEILLKMNELTRACTK